MAKPEEVAKLIAFLASDDAEFIDGEVIKIDGGYKLGWGEKVKRVLVLGAGGVLGWDEWEYWNNGLGIVKFE